MFKKQFRVKSRNVAKNSERRKFRSLIGSTYNLQEEDLEKIIPSKGAIEVSKLIVNRPSACDRDEVNVTLYSISAVPLFFEFDRAVYPTVYALWRNYSLIQRITTWEAVLPRLISGADLLLPGVITPLQGGSDFIQLRKAEPCGINIHGNVYPMCVGIALMSGGEMIGCGMKGRGVTVLHTYRDFLWEAGPRNHPPQLPPPVPIPDHQPQLPPPVPIPDLQPQLSPPVPIPDLQPQLPPPGPTPDLQPQLPPPVPIPDLQPVESADHQQSGNKVRVEVRTDEETTAETLAEEYPKLDGSSEIGDEPKLSEVSTTSDPVESGSLDPLLISEESLPTATPLCTEEDHPFKLPEFSMDDLLFHCFVFAVRKRLKNEHLPILASTFYKTHLLVECPKGIKLDIKKTKHRKLSSFLTEMSEEGVLVLEELSPGVDAITSVEFKHPLIRRYESPSSLAELIIAKADLELPADTPKISEGVVIEELLMPAFSALEIFKESGYNKLSTLKPSDIRQILTSYVKNHQLVSPSNKSEVRLDAALQKLFQKKGQSPIIEMTWSDLMRDFLALQKPVYIKKFPDGYTIMKKGTPPSIKVTVVQRSGNKKATLVDNLDCYDIVQSKFAASLQKRVAASASVVQSSSNPNEKQVFIQGDMTKTIVYLLTDNYKIPSKYIKVENKVTKTRKR